MIAESGGPHGVPIDASETFRHAAVPQTEFRSQNAHRNHDRERFFTEEAASAANIYGQRFVEQKGQTSIGPHRSKSLKTDLKPSFDMAITEGMNRLLWHEWTSSPAATGLPGQEIFAGNTLTSSAPAVPLLAERSIEAAWTVQFQAGRSVDAEAFVVPAMTSRTTWPVLGSSEFSGTATYTAQLAAPAATVGKEIMAGFHRTGRDRAGPHQWP